MLTLPKQLQLQTQLMKVKQTTMTAHWIDNQKNLMLFSGRAHPGLGEAVAKELGVKLTPMTARDFANGEIFVRF